MGAASPRRRAGLAVFIICLLIGSVAGLMAGGFFALYQGIIFGAMAGNIGRLLVLYFERIPRRALLGGVVGAAVWVALDIFWLKPPANPILVVPAAALGGAVLGAILAAPPWRFPLRGALIGAVPMPLLGFVFFMLAPYGRPLAMIVTMTLAGALLLGGVGWMLERSTANLWRWARAGAIAGFLFIGAVQLLSLLSRSSRAAAPPVTLAEMMLTLKLLVGIGMVSGALLGAAAGILISFPEFLPKGFGNTKE